MKTTTYICDTCKKSVSEKDLIELSVSVKNLSFSNDDSINRHKTYSQKIEICKDCLVKKGFKIVREEKETEEELAKRNEKVLSEKILDILEDLGVCFTDHDHNY